ncbi:MAG: DUF1573 domain-containing protein [Planctomycetota bacterium]|nr:DUF1573 domain-containing protein [Planctomycetota bacterium]
MRLFAVLLVIAVLAMSVGVGLTWQELRSYYEPPKGLRLEVLAGDSTSKVPSGPAPRVVVVNGETFDFGAMERDSTRSHTFQIRNDGDAPLRLIKRGTSCKCTVNKFADADLLPGGTADVTLEWTANTGEGEFRQTANIETNDPRQQSLTLTVIGRVTFSYRLDQPDIVVTKLNSGKETTEEVKLFGYTSVPIDVKEKNIVDSGNAEYFDVSVADMPADQVAAEPDATSGKILTVTIKKGLPLGSLNELLRVTLDAPGEPVVEIPILGTVVGGITIVGPQQWDSERDILRLGRVKSAVGKKFEGMYLLIKGQKDSKLALTTPRISPKFMQVHFQIDAQQFIPDKDLPEQGLIKVPFTVEIPPDSPIGSYDGSVLGAAGRVDIECTEPERARVHFEIRFVIEN